MKKRIEELIYKVNSTSDIYELEELRDNIMSSDGHPKAKYFVLKAIDLKLDTNYSKSALVDYGELCEGETDFN